MRHTASWYTPLELVRTQGRDGKGRLRPVENISLPVGLLAPHPSSEGLIDDSPTSRELLDCYLETTNVQVKATDRIRVVSGAYEGVWEVEGPAQVWPKGVHLILSRVR